MTIIKYDPGGEHAGWDLTGWWVRWEFEIGGTQKSVSGKSKVLRHVGYSVYIGDGTVNVSSVTHLLGVERRRLHPQEVADLYQKEVKCCVTVADGEEYFGWYIEGNMWLQVDSYLVESYSPKKHRKLYEPRPPHEGDEALYRALGGEEVTTIQTDGEGNFPATPIRHVGMETPQADMVMRIRWDKIPEWIEWVTFDFDHGGRALGWCTKPSLTGDSSDPWTNFYCEEDDGYLCEIPHAYAHCHIVVPVEKRIQRRGKYE